MPNDNGKLGEDFATDFLEKNGYIIICRNYHKKCGEIDIVAKTADIIAFVEVKTRAKNYMVSPIESVGYKKRQRIIKTAILYLESNPLDLQPRFDVFEIITKSSTDFAVVEYDHIKSAFDASEYKGFY